MGISRPGLKRSRDQRMIAGVCGGIAEWLGWSATSVRIAFFLVSVLSAAFPGALSRGRLFAARALFELPALDGVC